MNINSDNREAEDVSKGNGCPTCCLIRILRFVFVFEEKQFFLIFICIRCNQITLTTEAFFLLLGTLKLLLSIYFSMGLSVSNYFVLMLCEYFEFVPPLIPATRWVYLYISTLTHFSDISCYYLPLYF